MPETVTQNETEQLPVAVAALEEPFDPTEIKWRATNTTQIGSRNGPRFRGQVLAYGILALTRMG
jgi:hypothetical protein